ncbi:hypothetical protein M378DRAFT_625250 [Amanita muscaria Koide BX008]|uniref:Uncharacterized protein n=1 Tax=Amanita muscaria (strain Koide BX008) TaxID=946122 RepID=A0A0C2T3S7_AMAMK|nr:hypothetical protein M378DRAFT_625250 [Amanita muscaria Koide BX008]
MISHNGVCIVQVHLAQKRPNQCKGMPCFECFDSVAGSPTRASAKLTTNRLRHCPRQP